MVKFQVDGLGSALVKLRTKAGKGAETCKLGRIWRDRAYLVRNRGETSLY